MSNMRNLVNYSANFGLYNFIVIWIDRLILLTIIIIALSKYDENPTGLTILSVILLISLIKVSSEELNIYDDSIEFKKKLFLDLIPISKQFNKDDIEDIKFDGHRSLKNNLILSLLPFGFGYINSITIKLREQNPIVLRTKIFIDELERFNEKLAHNKL